MTAASPVTGAWTVPAQGGLGGLVPQGSRTFVFDRIFTVFLVLGTAVGAVVVGYMLYNAYRYRGTEGGEPNLPELGGLPSGTGGGRKLFASFAVSTVIVLSLIGWTYGTLLFVESGPPADVENTVRVDVEGYQFGWQFTYPNGHTERGTLRVPADSAVRLEITSADVFHNFGIPALNVKADAIPDQTTDTWFTTDAPANYTAQCYELCGVGHSYMTADVVVMDRDAYEAWYANTSAGNATASNGPATGTPNATAAGESA